MEADATPLGGDRSFMESHRRIALPALMAAAAVLWVHGLGTRSLWLDESYSAWFTGLGWTDLWVRTPRYEPHPPFYYSILKLWSGIAGDGAAALRMPSVLAGIACVAALAAGGRMLGHVAGVRHAVLAGAAAGVVALLSPRLLVIAQEARPYSLLVLSYAVATIGWLGLSREFLGDPRAPGEPRYWLMLGIGTELTLWLHGIGFLYAGALLSALAVTAADRPTAARWRRLAATVGATALLYLPCLVMMARRASDWRSGWLEWDRAGFVGGFLQIYGFHRFDEELSPRIAIILFPALIYLGLRTLWRAKRPRIAIGMGMLVVVPPLAAGLLSELGTPIFLLRTQVAVLAPAYLLVGLAIAGLAPRPRAVAAAATVGLLAVNLVQAVERPEQEPWGEIARILGQRMRAGDRIWTYPNDLRLPLQRVLGPRADIVPLPAPFPALDEPGVRNSGSPGVVTLTPQRADAWRASRRVPATASIWLVRAVSPRKDPNGVTAALARGRAIERVRDWPSVDLVVLRPTGPD